MDQGMRVPPMAVRMSAVVVLTLASLALTACSSATPASQTAGGEASAEGTPTVEIVERYALRQALDFSMTLTTTSIEARSGRLDRRHSCERGDRSPHLAWEGIPEGTESLALIVEDPASDVHGRAFDVLWTHWVLYSIPPDTTELEADQAPRAILENGAKQGANDYDRVQYNGPCPIPRLTFRNDIPRSTREAVDAAAENRQIKPEDRPYYFRLYALDLPLDLAPGADRDTLLEAIDGHVLAAGELAVNYKSVNSRYCWPTLDPEVCLTQVRRGPTE